MQFVAILATTPEGRVAKFETFDSWQEAQDHADQYINAFVVANPTQRPWPEWVLNPSNRSLSFSPPDAPLKGKETLALQAIRLLAEDASPATKAAVLALLP